MIKSIFPTHHKCFLISLILFLVGVGMASSYAVFRNRLDDEGHVIMDSNGRTLVEIDQWASFWNGWPSNLPIVAAMLIFALGVVLWARSKLKKGSRVLAERNHSSRNW